MISHTAKHAEFSLFTLPQDLQEVMHQTMRVITSPSTPVEDVWPPVLEALMRTVEGIDGATLSIREQGVFVIRAQYGYTSSLLGLELPDYSERLWYGLSETEWRAGQARRLQGEQILAHLDWMNQALGHLPHHQTLGQACNLRGLQDTVLVPLLLDGEVCAHLNLDGFTPRALDGVTSTFIQGNSALLTTLLAVVNSSRRSSELQQLREERDALRVHLQLSERLRRVRDPEALIWLGLTIIQTGFRTEFGFRIEGNQVNCTDGRTIDRAVFKLSPLGHSVVPAGALHNSVAFSVLTVKAGEDQFIGLAWPAGRIVQHELLLEALVGVADRAELAAELDAQNIKLLEGKEGAMFIAGLALEARDLETRGHTERVMLLSDRLATALNLNSEDRRTLRYGAVLHDIGKLGLPDSVLLKPGPLTADEWALMRTHPELGIALARRISGLPSGVHDIILHHHEHWNGQGYPGQLVGTAIPCLARIFSVVDAFDALTSTRTYKPAWSMEEALEELEHGMGSQFDPDIVPVLRAVLLEADGTGVLP
ncbi:HD-GYP domain-containing protein [Deinococcus altitudinis]|uniref:HD-GYP domain-containing protein n=1 Tax=Deinococcus altitudinis TaxID=468914 RepID=UPI003891B2F0